MGNELMSVLFGMVSDTATREALLAIADTPEGHAVADSVVVPADAVGMIVEIGAAFGVDTSSLPAADGGNAVTAADVLPVVVAIGVETKPFVELLVAAAQ